MIIPNVDKITDSQAILHTNEVVVRRKSDYISPKSTEQDLDRYLHSTMKNSFYRTLLQVILDERKNLYDRAYELRDIFDISPHGDNDAFIEKVDNMSRILNVDIPAFFSSYLIAEDPARNELDETNEWIRLILETQYLAKRYAGSRAGYNLAFTRMRRFGTCYLQSSYRLTEIVSFLDIYYGRVFRIVDVDQLVFNTLSSNPDWPNVPSYITPALNYPSGLKPLRYDTERTYDTGYNDGDPPASEFLIYDNTETRSPKDKGLLLEYTLDRLLYHTNSLKGTLCLIDDPWFSALSTFIQQTKKVSDPVNLGAQISLTGQATGRMSEYTHAQAVSAGDDRDIYTHPNIQARFQVFRTRWEANSLVKRIELGTGELDATEPFTFFIKEGENPAAKEPFFPTALQSPFLFTEVGEEEQTIYGGYTLVYPTVKKIDVADGELIEAGLDIPAAAGDDVVLEADRLIFNLPHQNLAPGTCSFEISFTIDTGEEDLTRVFLLSEVFNPKMQSYNTDTTLWKVDEDGNRIAIDPFMLIDYITDSNYSEDDDYFPAVTDDFLILGERETPPVVDPKTGQWFTSGEIDYELGRLILYTKLSYTGLWKDHAALAGVSATVTCNYSINSYVSKNSPLSSVNNLIGISEVGVFNTDDVLVAYGTFPRIIYNPNLYHLSLNLAIEN